MSGLPESSHNNDGALTREEYYARIYQGEAPVQHPDILETTDEPTDLSSAENPVGTTAVRSVVDHDEPEGWKMRAKCRGSHPSIFFPSDGPGVELAHSVCIGCEVRSECLEYALENRIEHGVWGGASERERRRILRSRRLMSS